MVAFKSLHYYWITIIFITYYYSYELGDIDPSALIPSYKHRLDCACFGQEQAFCDAPLHQHGQGKHSRAALGRSRLTFLFEIREEDCTGWESSWLLLSAMKTSATNNV